MFELAHGTLDVSDGIKEMLKFAQIPASQAEKVADGVCKVATNCDTCQKPPVVHSIQFDNAEVQNQALKAIRNMIRYQILVFLCDACQLIFEC